MRLARPWVRAFRRAGHSGRGWGPYRRTLWPIWAASSPLRPLSLYPLADKGLGPVGGPYRSTLWPFRRLATYPSYPYRVVPPCPRTLSKFSGLATYPLGLGEVRALETFIFLRKWHHGRCRPRFYSEDELFASPPSGPPGPPKGPHGAPGFRPKGPEGPPGGTLGPPGPLGPQALRAGGLGKHGLAITRSALERHGLSKGRGLAVFGEAGLG